MVRKALWGCDSGVFLYFYRNKEKRATREPSALSYTPIEKLKNRCLKKFGVRRLDAALVSLTAVPRIFVAFDLEEMKKGRRGAPLNLVT